MITSLTFIELPPELLSEVVRKAKLSSNEIVAIIKMLRINRKEMIKYIGLYNKVDYKDLSLTNQIFMLEECQDQTINFYLASVI